MSRAWLAAFPSADRLVAAAEAAQAAGRPAIDAFTPYPVEGLTEALGLEKPKLPWIMLAGGVGAAAGLYLLEWFSASKAYPMNLGGRPLHSWPAFVIAPVELGVLVAAISGFVSLLVKAGLPRLNHPVFEHEPFERASQDQFVLAIPRPTPEAAEAVRRGLFEAGAVWIEETEL